MDLNSLCQSVVEPSAYGNAGAEDQSRTDDTCIFSAVLYH
jgi:hypothetical protein